MYLLWVGILYQTLHGNTIISCVRFSHLKTTKSENTSPKTYRKRELPTYITMNKLRGLRKAYYIAKSDTHSRLHIRHRGTMSKGTTQKIWFIPEWNRPGIPWAVLYDEWCCSFHSYLETWSFEEYLGINNVFRELRDGARSLVVVNVSVVMKWYFTNSLGLLRYHCFISHLEYEFYTLYS